MSFALKYRLSGIGKKRIMSLAGVVAFAIMFLSAPGLLSAAFPSQASGSGSITNTRHNLSQSFMTSPPNTFMDLGRNQYNEVCVYCHTPHGSNQQEPNLPLWNHTIPDKSTFSIYESTALNKMQGAMSTPGPASLTCLSCHDGTIAIDSIINMPTTTTSPGNGGSTMWLEGTPGQAAFLGSWSGGPVAGIHMPLGYVGGPGFACEFCHTGVIAPDFSVFAIGKNLTNDHPVGVVYPTTFGPDVHFNQPSDTTADGRIKYFEDAVGSSGAPSTNNNNHLNTNEIRLYDSGDGFEVECASCHDPHGVTSDGSAPWGGSFDTAGLSRSGTAYNTSFLRISNSDSDVCLTCHDK